MSWTKVGTILPGVLLGACAKVTPIDEPDAGQSQPSVTAIEPQPGVIAPAAKFIVPAINMRKRSRHSARAKTRASRRPDRKRSGAPRSKAPRSKAPRSKSRKSSTVRATTPARSTHSSAMPRSARTRTESIPSPMPLRHVAPSRPVLVAPARSMPPLRDNRKAGAPAARGPLVMPDFAEAGVVLAITYSIREGRRGEFFDLMREILCSCSL